MLLSMLDPGMIEQHLVDHGTGRAPQGRVAYLDQEIRNVDGLAWDTVAQLAVEVQLVNPRSGGSFLDGQVRGRADVMLTREAIGAFATSATSGGGGQLDVWLDGTAARNDPAVDVLGLPSLPYSSGNHFTDTADQRLASTVSTTSFTTDWRGPVVMDAVLTLSLALRRPGRSGSQPTQVTRIGVNNLVQVLFSPRLQITRAPVGDEPVRVPSGWLLPATPAAAVTGQDIERLAEVQQVALSSVPAVSALHLDLVSAPDTGPQRVLLRGTRLPIDTFVSRYLVPVHSHEGSTLVMLRSWAGEPTARTLRALARLTGMALPTDVRVAVAGPAQVWTVLGGGDVLGSTVGAQSTVAQILAGRSAPSDRPQ